MQQHYQIINLHNIIKTQEFKIHELREQLRIANEREQCRYQHALDNSQIKIDEKQKMIEFLKGEMEKIKNSRYQDLDLQKSKFQKDQSGLQKELISYKKKCIQLEGKIKRTENEAEIKIQEVTENYLKLSQQMNQHQRNKNYLTIEISKLNHFYKNSLFQISKRKQTLLWVEKFTEYLDDYEQKQKKTLLDINSYVKSELQLLRTQLSTIVTDVAKCQKQIWQKIVKTSDEMKIYIKNTEGNSEKLLVENQEFWNKIIRTQRDSEKNQCIKNLQEQMQKLKKEQQKELNEMRSQIKIYETEKKTLILGFQELRSLNQEREITYKEQIKVLKSTVDELMSSAEDRDKQFQNQIKILTGQIEQISQRYYENIDFPIRKINQKISLQTQSAKNQIKFLQQDLMFQKTVSELQKIITYHAKGTSKLDQNLTTEIQAYISHSTTVLTTIIQLLKCDKTFHSSKNIQSEQIDAGKQLKELEERQKLNKSIYEASLAKKHLAKLQNYYQQQQKKIQTSSKVQQNKLMNKIIELQAENESLKQNMERSKEVYEKNLILLKKKNNLFIQQRQKQQNIHKLFYENIQKMTNLNFKLESYIEMEQKKYAQIQDNLMQIKKFIQKPLQSIENVYKQLKQMNDSSFFKEKTSRFHENTFSDENRRTNNKSFQEDAKNYRQILSKRSENISSTQRLITDLIKTMRQIQYKNSKGEAENTNKLSNQRNMMEQKGIRTRGIEKKFKELQNERIKEKQQFRAKIQKLQSQLTAIVNKQKKSTSLKKQLEKFQSNFNEKIDSVIGTIQLKLNKKQINIVKEEVIADLRAKLAQANIQNEGLRKQMNLQYTINKRQ